MNFIVAATLTGAAAAAHGQARGDFVVPGLRGEVGSEFGYWDRFEAQGGGSNYLYDNPPGLLGGRDSEGHPTTLTVDEAVLVQTGTPTAFVTSSGAIYSFQSPTAFEFRYSGEGEVSGVVAQVVSGGTVLDLEDVRLVADGGERGELVLAADYKALDEPGSGGFAERVVSAFQWDLTGLGVSAFRVEMDAPGSSMAVWEAQLDVQVAVPFVQSLGYVLEKVVLPELRWGVPGEVVVGLPRGSETRFFLPGQPVPLLADPESGFWHAGWVTPSGELVRGGEMLVGFADRDEVVAAIFAPLDYETWRESFFYHSNTLLGLGDDYEDEAISGKGADPDGDGVSNWGEFAFGGDPYVADPLQTGIAIGKNRELTFRRWAVPDVEAGVVYRVMGSDDLLNWVELEAGVTGVELQADGTELVTVELPVGQGRFFAVRAEEVPF